jgi:hypothetical protein
MCSTKDIAVMFAEVFKDMICIGVHEEVQRASQSNRLLAGYNVYPKTNVS